MCVHMLVYLIFENTMYWIKRRKELLYMNLAYDEIKMLLSTPELSMMIYILETY